MLKSVLNIDEHQLGVFAGNFLILLEQRFRRTLVNICVLEFVIYSFPR